MQVLVTGAFGYLGGRVSGALVAEGHEVVFGSRVAQPPPTWARGAKVAETDWQNFESLERACRGVDAVVHLAGASAVECAADPVAGLQSNGVGTARLVQAAIKNGVGRVVYASSVHVYDAELTGVIDEQRAPKNLHPYATSHVAGENAVRYAADRGAIEGLVVRLSNAFGFPLTDAPRCWALFANDMIRQGVQSGAMRIKSNPELVRDFVAAADVGRILAHLLRLSSDRLGDGVFNLGQGQARSLEAMAQLVAERLAVAGLSALIERDITGTRVSPMTLDVSRLAEAGIATPSDAGLMCEVDMTIEHLRGLSK